LERTHWESLKKSKNRAVEGVFQRLFLFTA